MKHLTLIVLLLFVVSSLVFAEDRSDSHSQFGGPASVSGQLAHDAKRKGPLVSSESWGKLIQPYFDFKDQLKQDSGFSFGVDYNALYQYATESLGEDDAASGAFRVFGQWELIGRESGHNKGMFNFKVENRHRLGTDISPNALGSEAGYAGLTAIPFSDADWVLNLFNWQQEFFDGKLAFLFGTVDTTEYVNVYGLVNPWTDFSNLAFSTDPTIPVPSNGVGAAVRGNIADDFYVLAGLADANGDPTDPWESYNNFFNDSEYFKHAELGWIGSWEHRFQDNVHFTYWEVDKRDEAGVPSGHGWAVSASHLFADVWVPFLRFASSNGGGGAFLEDSISAGVGRYMRSKSDFIGFGFNWGKPSEKTYGPGLDDQFTLELYYRLQLLKNLAITPDVQLLINPAEQPDEDVISIWGIRARLAF